MKACMLLNSALFGYVDAWEGTLMSTFESVWSGTLVRINSFAIFFENSLIVRWMIVYLGKKKKKLQDKGEMGKGPYIWLVWFCVGFFKLIQ